MRKIRGAVAVLGLVLAGGWIVPARAQTVSPKGDQSPAGSKKHNETPAPQPAIVTVGIVSQVPQEDRENLKGYWGGVEERTKQRLLQSLPAAAKPPLSTAGVVTIVGWIHTDGRATGMTVEHGAGNAALDRAALAAVTGAAPYGAFPYGIAVDQVKVRFSVEFNPGTAAPVPSIIH